ncbi:MAG TPA: alpha/beta hydrolase [Polyangiales bacterium]
MTISHEARAMVNARERLGVPADAERIRVEGVELAVMREGVGPPLVCLHATGHGGGDFAQLARELAHEYQVIRVDWPDHGRSADGVPASAERYGALLIALLDGLGVQRPTLLGNSIGGAAAIHYARARPVHALVLCNSGGLVPVDRFTRAFCLLLSRFFAAGARGARWFKPLFALYYRHFVLTRPAAAEQRERIIAAGYEIAPVMRDAWRSFADPRADLRAMAAALEIPVWAAWGRLDRVLSISLCRPALERMPRMTLSAFEASHAAFLEQPAEFLTGFRAFMAGVGLASADSAGALSSASHPSST